MRWARWLLILASVAPLTAAEGAIGVIFMPDPSPGVLRHFGGVEAGVVVTEAIADSPAAKAGLRLGDVIVAIDGKPVADFEDLRKLVGELVPGRKAEVKVRRRNDHADGHTETTVQVDVVPRDTFRALEEPR